MQNLNLSKQKFLLKIQKLNLKMLKLKKTEKYLRKFSWIYAQKKSPAGVRTLFHWESLPIVWRVDRASREAEGAYH